MLAALGLDSLDALVDETVPDSIRLRQPLELDGIEDEGRPPCYVEVKNVTLRRTPDTAEFPDAVTKRGAKHLEELAEVARGGERAVLFFLVQRGDCKRLKIAADIDPDYADAFNEALKAGLEVLCYNCKIRPEAIELDRSLELSS